MHYFFEDLAGVTAATLLCVLLLLLPGFAIAQLLNRRGWIRSEGPLSTCWGIVLGPAVLPAIDALLLRWLGFGCAIFIHAALAAAGIRPAVSAARRVPLKWWWAVAGCFAAAAWANVDFDWNGHLFQPLGILDSVKHAAVIGALATKGVPLHDPFFARPGIAGYYYYFYIGPALIHWLAAPLIDSRCAFAGATFTILLAFPALLILVAEDADLIPAGSLPRFIKLICLLCCVSGLDLLPGLWIWARPGPSLLSLTGGARKFDGRLPQSFGYLTTSTRWSRFMSVPFWSVEANETNWCPVRHSQVLHSRRLLVVRSGLLSRPLRS